MKKICRIIEYTSESKKNFVSYKIFFFFDFFLMLTSSFILTLSLPWATIVKFLKLGNFTEKFLIILTSNSTMIDIFFIQIIAMK